MPRMANVGWYIADFRPAATSNSPKNNLTSQYVGESRNRKTCIAAHHILHFSTAHTHIHSRTHMSQAPTTKRQRSIVHGDGRRNLSVYSTYTHTHTKNGKISHSKAEAAAAFKMCDVSVYVFVSLCVCVSRKTHPAPPLRLPHRSQAYICFQQPLKHGLYMEKMPPQRMESNFSSVSGKCVSKISSICIMSGVFRLCECFKTQPHNCTNTHTNISRKHTRFT